jgi:DNA-binding GntR family transcriptional regulator
VESPPERLRHRSDSLARRIASEILDGRRPVGTYLPMDADIASQFSVGMATVRGALKRLEALGLVARSRSAGARVVSGEIRASYEIAAIARNDSGGAYAAETLLVIERQRRVVADADLALLLAVREGSRWLCLSGRRVSEDASFGPLSWVDVWLDCEAASAGAITSITPATVTALTGFDVAEIVEVFSASPLTPAQARNLGARGGTLSMHVMRRYLRGNGALLAAIRDVHPADRVNIAVRLAGR